FYYKLDSDSGEVWIVDSLDSGAGMTYKLALCKNQYNGQIFGMSTIFKEITFYHYQSDTIIHEFSWPQFTFILAYGIGEVMQIDEEGGGPVKILQGCIIDGDTLGTITTAVEVNNSPYTLELNQNYPNPFNPATTIEFSLPESQNVKLIIYSLLGEKIKVLVDEYKTIGKHSVLFRAEGLPSGVYIYTLTTKNIIVSKKLILIK
ncbi:MAG: T9SS type A sorting domain-containing protein, partial [Ignavibacteriaceae bacterium]|nr:T9SS type A sorting domain-containing protein [Ignavibacteriaceae bacterium]